MSFREKLFTSLATAMAIGLFWTAGRQGMGEPFRGAWHYTVHFGTFALFAAMWRLALPRVAPAAIAAGVVTFAFVHEAYEILGHAHRFELADAVVDGLGATFGLVCLRPS